MTTAISGVETRQGRGVPTPARVEMILSRLDQLPSPPAVAMRLLNVTTSDDSSVRDVVRIVKADASLTAAVLRMARRADLGIREDTMTVDLSVAPLASTSPRHTRLPVPCLSTVHPVGDGVGTNRPKAAAYRAPGSPMSAFAVESVMDEVAGRVGMDPIEFRLKNAPVEGSQAAYGPKFGPIGYVQTLEAAKAHDHYKARLKPGQGRGVHVLIGHAWLDPAYQFLFQFFHTQ